MHTTNRREVWDQEQLGGDVIGPVGIMKRFEAKATKEVGVGGKEANGECAQYHARTRRFLSWTLGSRSG